MPGQLLSVHFQQDILQVTLLTLATTGLDQLSSHPGYQKFRTSNPVMASHGWHAEDQEPVEHASLRHYPGKSSGVLPCACSPRTREAEQQALKSERSLG